MTKPDFNLLVHQLSRKLYGYAYRILTNQVEAEDAVQEVFIKLWDMSTKLDEYNSPDALSITMTKNYCIDQLRKRKHNISEEYKNQEFKNSTSITPFEQLENKENNEIIFEIIEQLPEAQKLIIKLREIEGLTYQEISEKTGQHVNALRVVISRARKVIKDEYNKYHYERKEVGKLTRKVL
jgi:RNA polymerase sigma-70 factor (ECF subfamily)